MRGPMRGGARSDRGGYVPRGGGGERGGYRGRGGGGYAGGGRSPNRDSRPPFKDREGGGFRGGPRGGSEYRGRGRGRGFNSRGGPGGDRGGYDRRESFTRSDDRFERSSDRSFDRAPRDYERSGPSIRDSRPPMTREERPLREDYGRERSISGPISESYRGGGASADYHGPMRDSRDSYPVSRESRMPASSRDRYEERSPRDYSRTEGARDYLSARTAAPRDYSRATDAYPPRDYQSTRDPPPRDSYPPRESYGPPRDGPPRDSYGLPRESYDSRPPARSYEREGGRRNGDGRGAPPTADRRPMSRDIPSRDDRDRQAMRRPLSRDSSPPPFKRPRPDGPPRDGSRDGPRDREPRDYDRRGSGEYRGRGRGGGGGGRGYGDHRGGDRGRGSPRH